MWLAILVCLVTSSNGVNPYDTNFFKAKRKHLKAFLSDIFQGSIDNHQNLTRNDYINLIKITNSLNDELKNELNHNHNSQLTTSSTASQASSSVSINNFDSPMANDILSNLIGKKIAYANEKSMQANKHRTNGVFEHHNSQSLESDLECKLKVFTFKAINT